MARHQRFWQKDYFAHVGATIFFVCSFIGLVFVTVGTPLGMFMRKTPFMNDKGCFTLWGYHPNCNNAAYGWRVDFDDCVPRRTRLQCGEAFSCLAIFSILLQMYLAYEQLGGHLYGTAIIGVAVLSIASTTVGWAVVAALYHNAYCGSNLFTHVENSYGPGFSLLIVSWAVQIIGLVAFIVAEPSKWVKQQVDPYV